MRIIVTALLSLFMLTTLFPHGETSARPGGFQFSSGNWKGRAYYSNNDGRFLHCAMTAPYTNGNILLFSIARNATMIVSVSNNRWRLSKGSVMPVVLEVDGIPVHEARGKAISSRQFIIPFKSNKTVFALLRKGKRLIMRTGKGRMSFSLQGTDRALIRLLACAAAAMKAERIGSESIFQ